MGSESWSLTAKMCDSCQAAAATVFCRADSAFLCVACDGEVHAANKLASRHGRVWVCEVCEQAPASVTCKADAAKLCHTCDHDIHSANPLARRHERLPVVPFYDSASAAKSSHSTASASKSSHSAAASQEFSEEEAEAASWLLTNPHSKLDDESGSPEYKSAEYLFSDVVPYLDLDLISGEQKLGHAIANEQKQYSSDGVVPVQSKNEYGLGQYPGPVVDGFPTYDVDYPGSKPFLYNFTSESISQSVSSSSLEVGVVPDHNAMADVSKSEGVPTRVSGIDREARVLRYREKRKNRKFVKTIRYASRKAYAETRPRIKGRFAKRSELEVDSLIAADASYGVVPTF